jgi:hypothetical protein
MWHGDAVPRFHFNVSGNGKPDGPSAAAEFPDFESARNDAIAACCEMLRDLDGALPKTSEWRMDVTDAAGATLFTLRFSESGHPE